MDEFIADLQHLRRLLVERRRAVVKESLEGDVSDLRIEAAGEALASYKAMLDGIDAAIFDERRGGQMTPNA